jgi:Holliday junction resolvase
LTFRVLLLFGGEVVSALRGRGFSVGRIASVGVRVNGIVDVIFLFRVVR